MAADDEAAMNPAEEVALVALHELLVGTEELLVGADELRAAADAAARVARALSQREAALQELIREGMESGDLTEEHGRELSAYLSGAASGHLIRYALDNDIPDEIRRKYGELLVTEMVVRNRGLYAGDYTSRISTAEPRSPELEAMLAEMRELMREYVQAPRAWEQSGEWSGRVRELRTRLREAIRVPEGRE